MANHELKVIPTADGSPTILVAHSGETYHSVHGAVQESMHVFIEHGLRYFAQHHPKKELRILEMGFGTGLNAWLTWQEAEKLGVSIQYHTIEAYPLKEEMYSMLNFGDEATQFQKLHRCPWEREEELAPKFAITKWNSTVQEVPLPVEYFDIVYYDAFAPATQPELWHHSVLSKIAHSMAPGAVFVTYCAKGEVKRTLKSLGLRVEALPGPPRKREMVRAIKI